MISREDITVYPDPYRAGITLIKADFGKRTYEASFSDDVPAMLAIDNLVEYVMLKELGVTKHDFIMKVGEYFDTKIGTGEH